MKNDMDETDRDVVMLLDILQKNICDRDPSDPRCFGSTEDRTYGYCDIVPGAVFCPKYGKMTRIARYFQGKWIGRKEDDG